MILNLWVEPSLRNTSEATVFVQAIDDEGREYKQWAYLRLDSRRWIAGPKQRESIDLGTERRQPA